MPMREKSPSLLADHDLETRAQAPATR